MPKVDFQMIARKEDANEIDFVPREICDQPKLLLSSPRVMDLRDDTLGTAFSSNVSAYFRIATLDYMLRVMVPGRDA